MGKRNCETSVLLHERRANRHPFRHSLSLSRELSLAAIRCSQPLCLRRQPLRLRPPSTAGESFSTVSLSLSLSLRSILCTMLPPLHRHQPSALLHPVWNGFFFFFFFFLFFFFKSKISNHNWFPISVKQTRLQTMGLPNAASGDLSSEMEVDAFRRLFPIQFYERHLAESIRPDGRALGKARDTTIALGLF